MERTGIGRLVGRELSSVEFVRGYVQLRFDGPCLTVYTAVRLGDAEPGAGRGCVPDANALVALVGSRVRGADVQEDVALTLRLESGVTLGISLRPEDYTAGPEVAMLVLPEAETWVW
jgi:hypothetical protein